MKSGIVTDSEEEMLEDISSDDDEKEDVIEKPLTLDRTWKRKRYVLLHYQLFITVNTFYYFSERILWMCKVSNIRILHSSQKKSPQ